MTRRLVTILSALSLLLLVAVVVLWVRSYSVSDEIKWERYRATHWAFTYSGIVHYRAFPWGVADRFSFVSNPGDYFMRGGYKREPGPFGFHLTWQRPPQRWDRLPGEGFRRQYPPAYRIVTVPLWAVVCVTLVLPSWWLLRFRGRWSGFTRTGLCPSCGYDLRATPGRCPECAFVPEARP